MGTSIFDIMIVTDGKRTCKASDLYTKKVPFIKRPQSEHDLSIEDEDEEPVSLIDKANEPLKIW